MILILSTHPGDYDLIQVREQDRWAKGEHGLFYRIRREVGIPIGAFKLWAGGSGELLDERYWALPRWQRNYGIYHNFVAINAL